MKKVRVTMTVDDIRKATVGQKVRIRRQGRLVMGEFFKVVQVLEPTSVDWPPSSPCVINFDGGSCPLSTTEMSSKFSRRKVHQ